ncbi:plasmid mobilization relaxosome protein MobC [Ruminococcus sp. NK3A76]|uniref:plasmid mobilization protein n=1 Tax=Ruminococcus sp. NK3A76 TaxID=877411 RepID=UPI000A57EECB|nr:plasmid mobilization relaxosome protein MobC [Ruminococcus sp. NK3A76]
MKIARKNKTLRRKEIVYSAEEWAQIEEKAKACHLKTSTFIRAMSLNGEVKKINLKELAPLLNGMRVISRNINQVAKKANETCSIYAEDIEKLRQEVSELCRTVNLWLSTVMSSKR